MIIVVGLFLLERFKFRLMTFFCVEVLLSFTFLIWRVTGFDILFFFVVVGKMGLFPFWFWVVRLFCDFSFRVCFILVSFFKIFVVVVLFSYSRLLSIWWCVVLNFFGVAAFFFLSFRVSLLFCFFSILSSG